MHDTLAVTPEGLTLGVLDAQVWVRDWEEREAGRPIEQKESVKWLRSYEVAAKLQGQLKQTQVVSVGDREADLYELFAMAREHNEAGGPHVLVRASEDRRLAHTQAKLWEKVEAQPVAGYRAIAMPPRPGRKGRNANLSVRFCEVVCGSLDRLPQAFADLGESKRAHVPIHPTDRPTEPSLDAIACTSAPAPDRKLIRSETMTRRIVNAGSRAFRQPATAN